MDDQQDALPEYTDSDYGYESDTGAAEVETKKNTDITSKKPVTDTGKADKKPMNRMVKIAMIAVAVIAASAIFVALDMRRQQHVAPMVGSGSHESLSLDDAAQQKPVADAPANVDQPHAVNGVVSTPLTPANVPVSTAQQTPISTTPEQPKPAQSTVATAATSPQKIDANQVKPAVTDNQTDSRLAMVEARLDRIEKYLSSLSRERSSARQKKPNHHKKIADKTLHENKAMNKVTTPEVNNDTHAAKEVESTSSLSVAQPVKQDEPKASCSYRGGINNRAWVDCDGTIYSVRRGDYLPLPYGMVSGVNDQSGSVNTAGGVIQ
jgi:hypothetical protein